MNNLVKVHLPDEAAYIDTKTQNIQDNFLGSEEASALKHRHRLKTYAQKKQEMDLQDDENIANVVDLKKWKYRGQFNNKFLLTCPFA